MELNNWPTRAADLEKWQHGNWSVRPDREQTQWMAQRIAELEGALGDSLPQIETWAGAYPEDMFIEPDWSRVNTLLGTTLLTQVSAANMRHVAKRMWGILEPVRAALTDKEGGRG